MENKVYITKDNDPRDYVGYNLFGYPYNKKYPPNKEKYGQHYEGYPCKALGVLLYDYCVMGYDVDINYNGQTYFLLDAGEAMINDNDPTKRRKEVFDSPMALVENFKIDGKSLLELAPEIEDIEPV